MVPGRSSCGRCTLHPGDRDTKWGRNRKPLTTGGREGTGLTTGSQAAGRDRPGSPEGGRTLTMYSKAEGQHWLVEGRKSWAIKSYCP